MGKAEKELLNQTLTQHLSTIHETLQVLDHTPASSLEKISWNDVIQMGDQVSKQATIAGMLWTGLKPEVKELYENMATYFNTLQGFLLLSHGSKVDAGPTLSSSIQASVKQVVDCSFMLFKESISCYGSHNKDQKLKIPPLVGTAWDACSALKKTPPTNIIAIGRAMTQVAVSMKDVLREMNELKPASTNPNDEIPEEASANDEIPEEGSAEAENGPHDIDDSCGDDLGNDLSPEEMKVAQMAIEVVSEALVLIKELIRCITGLLKQENRDTGDDFVDCLERLLKLSQGIQVQIDELGACLYPPQEFSVMKAAIGKISSIIDEMKVELDNVKGDSQAFSEACSNLHGSLRRLESELDCSSMSEVVPEMQNLVLST